MYVVSRYRGTIGIWDSGLAQIAPEDSQAMRITQDAGRRTEGGRPPWHGWALRVLRAAPPLAACAWLATFAVRYGLAGRGADATRGAFVAFAVAGALALASGAYEQTRMFSWLRARVLERLALPERLIRLTRRSRPNPEPIDWDAFDEQRARWERGRR